MIPKIIIMYSEIFDSRPTMDELIDLIKPLPLRHAALILSYINLVVRYGMQDIGEQNFSAAQASLFNGHFNDEAFELIKTRLGVTRCDERPIFVPQSVLALLRLVLVHSDPV